MVLCVGAAATPDQQARTTARSALLLADTLIHGRIAMATGLAQIDTPRAQKKLAADQARAQREAIAREAAERDRKAAQAQAPGLQALDARGGLGPEAGAEGRELVLPDLGDPGAHGQLGDDAQHLVGELGAPG